MASASHTGQSEKVSVYRAYKNGDATEEDVREVFGDDFTEFEEFNDLMRVVSNTTTNEPSDDLFC